jgi:3-methyl-2-oxobutanoate hydroxymethyltransferase
VSLTPIGEPRRKITTATLHEKKLHREPITCLTAYDYATARLVDESGIDIVLVGDSLAMTTSGTTILCRSRSMRCFTTYALCAAA